jgi:hypothetical protein
MSSSNAEISTMTMTIAPLSTRHLRSTLATRGESKGDEHEQRRLPENTTNNNKNDKQNADDTGNKDAAATSAQKDTVDQATAESEAEAINEQLQQDEEEAPVQDEEEALIEDTETPIQDEVLVQDDATVDKEEVSSAQQQDQTEEPGQSSNYNGDPLFTVDLLPLEVNVTVTKLSLDEQVGLGSFGTFLLEGSNKYLKQYFKEQNSLLLDNTFDSVSLRLTRLKEQDPLEEDLLASDSDSSTLYTATKAVQVNVTAVLDGSIAFSAPSQYDVPSTALIHILQLNAFGIPASALTQSPRTSDVISTSNNIVFASGTLYTKKEAHKWYLQSLLDYGWDNPYLREAESVYTDLYASAPFLGTNNNGNGDSGNDNGRVGGDTPQDATSNNNVGLSKMIQYAGTTAVAILALSVLLIGFLWVKKRRAFQESRSADKQEMEKPYPSPPGSKKSSKKRNSSFHNVKSLVEKEERQDREKDANPHRSDDAVNTTAEMSVAPSYLSKDGDGSKKSKASTHASNGTGGKSSLNAVTKASRQIAKAEKNKNDTKRAIRIFHHKSPPVPTSSTKDGGNDNAGRNMYQDAESDSEGFETETSRAPSSSSFFRPRYVDSSKDDSFEQGSVMESSVGEYTYNDQYTVNGDFDNMSMGFSLEGDDDLESVL